MIIIVLQLELLTSFGTVNFFTNTWFVKKLSLFIKIHVTHVGESWGMANDGE